MRELKEVDYVFSKLTHTKVVLIAGNHDYVKPDSYYRKYKWSSEVYFLLDDTLDHVEFPEIETCVYGLSYTSKEITEPLYDDAFPQKKQSIEILLAHGGDEKHIPIKPEDGAAFDYAALGHIHKQGILIPNQMAYAGALEPLDRNHEGNHGFIKGEIRDGRTQIQFVPFACRSYLDLEIWSDATMTQSELEQIVRERIYQQGKNNIYRIHIKGHRSPDLDFDLQRLYELGNVVEAMDETLPYYQLEKLRKQQEGTIIGEYIDCFEGKEEIIERKALFYGLQALMETEL